MRGILYGVGALAVPVSWSWGYRLAAVFLAVLVAVGVIVEASLYLRR